MPDDSSNSNPGTSNPNANGAAPSSANGSQNPPVGATSGNGAAAAPRPTVEPTVAPRRERYLVASRPLPGLAPMAADVIAGTLTNMSDVKIVKHVKSRGFGALSFGAGNGGMPDIVVAEMDATRGAALRATAPPNVIVERDSLLRHADDISMSFTDPAALQAGVGFDISLRAVGASGRPLPNAKVYVYGLGFPAQGQTNDRGEVTVTLFGGSLDTVQAIYVKPAADHWDRMFHRPALGDGVNSLQLHAFTDTFPGFPQAALTGWGQQMMKLDQIDASLTGQGVRIGIIDSGCDNSHPQLRQVTRGMDFTNNRDAASWITDTMSHGTHCAGIIAGAPSNQIKGIRGFAPMAEVHALKVFPGGRFSDLIDALDQCIERQIDIVNMSLGSGDSSELVAQKLVEVRRNGIACIVAAGNSSGPVQFPGTEASVLTVAALGKLDAFPSDSYHAETVVPNLIAGSMFSPKFTCFGPQIAVAAPGVAIVSTVPGGGYAAWDGTSMATPHVTGMGALLLAHHPLFRDGLRARNEQRVAQLFSLIASAAVRQLGDTTREGAGLPDLQRVVGLGATHPANGGAQVASAQPTAPALGGAIGNIAGQGMTPMSADIRFDPRFLGGQNVMMGRISPFAANGLAPSFVLNPAIVQQLLQLRSAGLI